MRRYGMCHITSLFWRCLRKIVQPALEVRVVEEVQEVQEVYEKEVEVEKRIRRRGNDQGSPNVAYLCVATRWWIRKECW